jgi:CheY-like chemotaxis protein
MRFFSSKKKGYFPSTSELLPSLIAEDEAKNLLAQLVDSREIFGEVARIKKCSEAQLMKELAQRIGLPFGSEISRIREETPWDAAYLSRGALPEVIDGVIVGAYSIDPHRIREILPAALAENIVIVTWSCLSSFVAAQQPRSETSNEIPLAPSPSLINLLSLILDEASSFGLSQANLTISPRGISYLLPLANGEPLTGFFESPSAGILEEMKGAALRGDTIQLDHGERVALNEVTPGHFLLKKVPLSDVLLQTAVETNPALDNTILLIEDDPSFSAIVAAVLKEGGYIVTACQSVSEAVTSLQQQLQPSAIISDLNVIDSAGKETIDRLISESGISPTRIIVLSNEDDGQLEASLVRLGLQGVIPKHRDPEVLLAHLDWVTKGSKGSTNADVTCNLNERAR